MKRYLFVVLALALVFALANPALAAGPRGGNVTGTFSLAGKITAIEANTVTVQVVAGNALVKSYIQQTVPLITTETTRFLANNGTTVTAITLADLKVGDSISASGTLANNVWTASRITAGAKLLLVHQ